MNRNELNRARTIEDIKNSFIELYEKKGIDNVSVREICEHIGISRTIFYRYFEDKYQILQEIEEELLIATKSLNRELSHTSLEGYEYGDVYPILYNTVNYIYEQRKYFKPILSDKGDPHFIFKWKKQIRDDARREIKNPIFKEIDPEISTELFAATCVGVYTYWFFEKPSLSVKQISEFISYLLHVMFVKVEEV